MALPDAPHALETRTYVAKKPSLEFYCPLCRSKRYFQYRPHLSRRQYVQVLLATMVVSLATFSLTSWRCFIFFFIFWSIVEFFNRCLLRKEVPCPYCGFDAAVYRRDVKQAKADVQAFWQARKILDAPIPAAQDATSTTPPPETPAPPAA